jgi:60 kDa SS-A/Ro ribonucleoprotein
MFLGRFFFPGDPMKLNTRNAAPAISTHEGAPAARIDAEAQLRRVVLASMLWEDQFYVDGQTNAQVIAETLPLVAPETAAEIAIEARERQKLRHVPLLIVRELARRKDLPDGLVAKTLERVIQRADEIAEFLAIYWKDGRQPLSAQVKKGLAKAFLKFDAYQLAKYDRAGAVRLRDALFLVHAKPQAEEQAATWKKLAAKELESPDTWEVAISATKGEGKLEEWTRLLTTGKLGALALLRNLRNMVRAGVDEMAIRTALAEMKTERVLPFRFIAAARHVPRLEDALEPVMLKCLAGAERLPGRTVLLVDVSGSMVARLSGKSDLTRMDAACGLAMLLREICEDVAVVSFSVRPVDVPARRGFALRDAIVRSQEHLSTYTGVAVKHVHASLPHDRLVIITDEQSADPLPDPVARGYVINVAAHQNGIGYQAWHHIDGWSEAVVDYVREVERGA